MRHKIHFSSQCSLFFKESSHLKLIKTTLSYYLSGCSFLFAVNVTNETGEDSLQIFGWQYWVSFGQIIYISTKELYRPASNDNVSSINSINYYNYSLFVMVVRHSDDEGKLGSIMIDKFRWYKERADRGSHSACWRKLKFVRNIFVNSQTWQADLFINPSQFGDSKFISSAVFE